MRRIHQLFAGDFLYRNGMGNTAVIGHVGRPVPIRQCKIFRKGLQLPVGTAKHAQRQMQCPGIAELRCKPYIKFCFRTIAVFGLQSRRKCGLIHLTYRRHIIIGYPLPQFVLACRDHRSGIHHAGDRLHLVTLRLTIVHPRHHSYIRLAAAERHEHTHTETYRHLHLHRYGIGEQPVERQWEYDVGIFHRSLKST